MTDFWQTKSLAEMTGAEWESLCDGCGKCCLHKLQDSDTEEVFYTDIACRILDTATARCRDYPNRLHRVPECLNLTPENLDAVHWLPDTCAYRLLAQGNPLPEWHPLRSGSQKTVRDAGVSVIGRVVSEQQVQPDDFEERIVYWVNH